MERLRRLYWNALSVPPERARRLTGIRRRTFPYCFKDVYNSLKKDKNQVYTRSLHAEENAFLQLAKYGGQGIKGGCLFTTASPCELCAKKAYQLGIKDIYYIDPYPGISFSHILKFGKRNNPNYHLFYGAIGTAYVSLYTQRIATKDELALMTDINCKRAKEYKEGSDRINLDIQDIKYICQESEFVFENRENMYSIESLEVQALHDGIKKISNVSYWTGSSFVGMKLSGLKRNNKSCDIDKDYSYIVKDNGSQPYVGILVLEEPLKKQETLSYKIKVELKDAAHIMNPYYAQIINMKTDRLILRVKAKKNLLKDVHKVIYADTLMTPEYEFEREEISAEEDGDFCVYSIDIEKPNLNYSYCLEWNFVIDPKL